MTLSASGDASQNRKYIGWYWPLCKDVQMLADFHPSERKPLIPDTIANDPPGNPGFLLLWLLVLFTLVLVLM